MPDFQGHGYHMGRALAVRGLRKEMDRARGFNAKVAIVVTGWVSTMWCAYAFALLALLSLPAIMTQAFHLHIFPAWVITPSLISLVAWVSSYFLQLVLLSVLSVQQAVEGVKTAAVQQQIAQQVMVTVDRLDTDTAGGITTILQRLNEVDQRLSFITVTDGDPPRKITVADVLAAKANIPPTPPRRRSK
jgi:hypothetical protein